MAFSQNAKSSIPRPGGVPPTKGAPAAAMVEPGVRRPAVDGAAVTDGLKTRLAAVLHGKESVSAGCFHLVGLAEVRKRLGPSWERVQDKVHAQTRRIIERHIAPRDVYFPNGPEDYVLVFAAMGKLAAQAVCAKIVEDVQRTLLGEDETREIGIRTVVSEMDGSLRLETTKLSNLLTSATAPAPGADDLAWAATDSPTAEPPRSPSATVSTQILYRPVWDVQREVVSTYFSRPEPPRGSANAKVDELIQRDIEMLRDGTELLADLYQNKFRLRLSLPVSFEAIAVVARRRAYFDLCQAIPEHLRKLIAFELNDLPPGVTYGRLLDLTTLLRPFCGLIFATVDWSQLAEFRQYASAGIRLVNAVIQRGVDEERSLADMSRFALAAEKAGLQSSVEGVGSSSLALAAKGAGIGFISGDRIGKCLEVPEHMLRLTWMEVYFGKQ